MGEHGIIWACSICGGRALSISLLRHFVARQPINHLWQAALKGDHPTPRACPSCQFSMVEVPLPTASAPFVLDVCKRCQFVWFDPLEFEEMPLAPPEFSVATPTRDLPMAAKEVLAEYKIKQIKEQSREGEFGEQPDEWWKCVPAFFGLPIEYDSNPLTRLPWVTWTCAVMILAISLAAFSDLRSVVDRFGLIPSEIGRMGGLTLISSFFLHGGVAHLLGNLYFLIVFGDNVEDFIGRRRFALLLIAATLCGDLFHVAADPGSTRPCIGASGGISGIIVFYALQFPQAKLGFLFRYALMFRWVSMRAYFALILWIVYQFLLAGMQMAGMSRVSAMAHLGGAAAGFFFWLWLRKPKASASDTG